MTKSNTRLELTWIGKETRPKLEPRILIEDPSKSQLTAHRLFHHRPLKNRIAPAKKRPTGPAARFRGKSRRLISATTLSHAPVFKTAAREAG